MEPDHSMASNLLYEWELAAEIGWARGLSAYETRVLLSELDELRPVITKLLSDRAITTAEAETVRRFLVDPA
jgi:hypothetical protein